MNKRQLQDVSKFLAGIVLADMITVVWAAQAGLLPLQAFGITITASMVLPVFIFDLALLIILIHYGWHIGKIPILRERGYLILAGAIFTVVAIAHLMRLFASADLVIMGWVVPLWLSWVGVVVTAYLAYASFRFAARIR